MDTTTVSNSGRNLCDDGGPWLGFGIWAGDKKETELVNDLINSLVSELRAGYLVTKVRRYR